MNPITKIKKLLKFFNNKPRENLVAGFLLFSAAIISVSPGIIWLLKGISSLTFSIINTNEYVSIILFSLFMMLPSLVLFSTAYLLWEGHSFGWKSAITIFAVSILLAILSASNIYFALPIAALSGIATIIELGKSKSRNNIKDTPIVTENVVRLGLRLSALICIMVVAVMVVYVVIMGSPFLSLQFFTSMTLDLNQVSRVCWGLTPTGPIGGVLSFAIGTLLLVTFCEFVAIPIGVFAAIYLAEYSSQNKLVSTIRFFIETLAGTPSIVMALIGFTIFSITLGWYYSLWGAAITLSFMALPWNIRVAEGALKSVPKSYREASYALGATQWQTTRLVTLYAALPGIITGILLGVGVAIGETLILQYIYSAANSFNLASPWWNIFNLRQPNPALTVLILTAGGSTTIMGNLKGVPGAIQDNAPFYSYSLAFAAATVLIVIYLALCVGALLLRNYLNKRMKGS